MHIDGLVQKRRNLSELVMELVTYFLHQPIYTIYVKLFMQENTFDIIF